MAVDIADLMIHVRETGADSATRKLRELGDAGERAQKAAGSGLGKEFDQARDAADRMGGSVAAVGGVLRAFGTVFTAVLGADALRMVVQIADKFELMSGKIRQVISDEQAFVATREKLFAMAQRTRTDLDATADLFIKVARSNEQIGRSQEDLLMFSELVTKAMKSSGASADETARVVRQLGQALSRDQLKGDEFVSVMENGSRVVEALQKSLGATRGELLELASKGKLTGSVIVEAMLKARESIENDFNKMPVTVGDSLQVLQNSVFRAIGTINERTSATGFMAKSISDLARDIDAGVAAFNLFADTIDRWADRVSRAWDRVKGFWDSLGRGPNAPRFQDNGISGGVGDSEILGGAGRDGLLGFAPGLDEMRADQAFADELAGILGRDGAIDRELRAASDMREDLLVEPFRNAIRNVQSMFADMFTQVFDGGKISFDRLAESAGKSFSAMGGNMLSAIMMRPFTSALDEMAKGGGQGGFLGLSGNSWGALGMVGGNIALNSVMGDRGAGAGIGSMLGGAIGSMFGPLGMVGGSLLGNVVGGLFGGKPSSGPVARANLMLENGQFGLGAFDADNGGDTGPVVQMVKQASQGLNALMKQFGLSASGGGFLDAITSGKYGGGFAQSPEELINRVLRSGRITGSGTSGTILRTSGAGDLAGLAADLEFGKLYDSLVAIKPVLTDVEQAVQTVKDQFAAAKDRAGALGLSLAALDEAMARTLMKMRDDFNLGIQDAILGILDPDSAAMRELERAQAERMKNAMALGANIVEVERLAGLERAKLIEDQQRAANQGLRQLIDELRFGDLGGRTVSDRFGAVESKYFDIESRALAGDRTARGEFEDISRQYVDLARANFASGAGFQDAVSRVLGSANILLGGAPASVNDNGSAAVAAAVTASGSNVVQAIGWLRDENRALREQVADLSETLAQFVGNQQAAGGRVA